MKGLIVFLLAAGGIGITMAIIQVTYVRIMATRRRKMSFEATWKSFVEPRDDGVLMIGVKKSYGIDEDEVVFRSMTLKTVEVGDLVGYTTAMLEADERADTLNQIRRRA